MRERTIKYNLYRSVVDGKPALTIDFNGTNYYEPTEDVLMGRFRRELRNDTNPDGKFLHPSTNQYINLVFTGNAMKHQGNIVDILTNLEKTNPTRYVTIRTDATVQLDTELNQFLISRTKEWSDGIKNKIKLVWEITIEENTDFSVLKEYQNIGTTGFIKFKVGNDVDWFHINYITGIMKETYGIVWPIWVESGLPSSILQEEAFNRGYNLLIVGN
jgi:hypothetical protein